MIGRREFITMLWTAAAWPLAARAQQLKLPTIGYLGANTPSAAPHWVAAFVQRLRELGWIDGRNLAIEYRWAEDRSERFAEIAAEFVRLKVDVILAHGTQGAIAAKQATAVTPIVATPISDPLRTGLVVNLARPGANVTGLSLQNVDIAANRIELLREGLPSHRRLAILANVSNPANVLEIGEVQVAARARGLEFASVEIRRVEEIAPAIEALKGRADVLYVCGDTLLIANRARISIMALGARLALFGANREFAEAGALMSYAANIPDLFRRAGDYVDKILRGAKPADIPVEQPTKFELVINLIVAKALGLELPLPLLARADEVIE